eukprot:Platyproteum_vivax@DN6961_c0_g1_i1.p1
MVYKLTHFDFAGKGDPVRLAFHIGGLEFEDIRVSFDEWSKKKLNGQTGTPLQELPTLEIDGVVFTQAEAILRHVGKLAGLYPEGVIDSLLVDELLQVVTNFMGKMPAKVEGSSTAGSSTALGEEPSLKLERTEWINNSVIPSLTYLEKKCQKSPFVLGDKISIADLTVLHVVNFFESSFLEHVDSHLLKNYPRLTNIAQTTRTYPKVSDFLTAKKLIMGYTPAVSFHRKLDDRSKNKMQMGRIVRGGMAQNNYTQDNYLSPKAHQPSWNKEMNKL